MKRSERNALMGLKNEEEECSRILSSAAESSPYAGDQLVRQC